MKICIFSDIHGNCTALKSMLDDVKREAESYIFVGDIFGYFYEQAEVIDILKTLTDLTAVMGNHDHYYIESVKNGNVPDDLIDRYGSSYKIELSQEQFGFIKSLPDSAYISLAGKKFAIFHGGPDDHLEQRIYPDTELEHMPLLDEYDYVAVGHTHYRYAKKIGRPLLINPGSLGQPRDGSGFSYCMLDTTTDTCEFRTVKADIQNCISEVEKRDKDRYVYSYLKNKYKDFNG